MKKNNKNFKNNEVNDSMQKFKKIIEKVVQIKAPNLQVVELLATGNAPLVMNKFSQKAREEMKKTQMAGQKAKKGKIREPKNFQACYEQSMHISREGWYGIPAGAFRAAMVSACRLVGFKMTIAKLCIFIIADGFDREEGTPLVKIIKGEPHYAEHPVRLADGTPDIRARAMWNEGWQAKIRVRFDADQFSQEDIANLLMRVGLQVGLLEGRPDSRKSCGVGWGTFEIKGKEIFNAKEKFNTART